jgi:hypothetical protein
MLIAAFVVLGLWSVGLIAFLVVVARLEITDQREG